MLSFVQRKFKEMIWKQIIYSWHTRSRLLKWFPLNIKGNLSIMKGRPGYKNNKIIEGFWTWILSTGNLFDADNIYDFWNIKERLADSNPLRVMGK